jgi:hypothetical protein
MSPEKRPDTQAHSERLEARCHAFSKTAQLRAEAHYQTRQEFSGYIGCPLWHPKAFPNSSKF